MCPCGVTLEGCHGLRRYCSDRCRLAADAARARLRREVRQDAWANRPCRLCGGLFRPHRADVVYCSAEHSRRAAKAEKPASKRRRRLLKYGLTTESHAALLERQGGRCAICRSLAPGGRGDWHIDHDHGTGATRGLLCTRCNVGLGLLGDSIGRLDAAARYLWRARGMVLVGEDGFAWAMSRASTNRPIASFAIPADVLNLRRST